MPITVVPALPSTFTFYKYEPFDYTFTSPGALTVTGSAIVTPRFTVNNTKFSGPFQAIGAATGETVTVSSSDGSSLSYTFFILAGRFQGPTSVSAYVGETFSSDYTTSGTTLANVFSTPTLPPGLRFTLIASSSAV